MCQNHYSVLRAASFKLAAAERPFTNSSSNLPKRFPPSPGRGHTNAIASRLKPCERASLVHIIPLKAIHGRPCTQAWIWSNGRQNWAKTRFNIAFLLQKQQKTSTLPVWFTTCIAHRFLEPPANFRTSYCLQSKELDSLFHLHQFWASKSKIWPRKTLLKLT